MSLISLRRTAGRDALWFLGVLVVLQIVFVVIVDVAAPEFYDPEYGVRLDLLRQQRRDHPESRLLLAVGSSRVGCGFEPEIVPSLRSASGEPVLPFNFTHLAAGPTSNLLALHRLVREGLKPDWLLLEFLPLAMDHEGMPFSLATAADLPVLARHGSPIQAGGIYARSRLNPFYKHRQSVLGHVAPWWRTIASDKDRITLGPLGGNDGWTQEATVSAEERRRRTEITRHNDAPRLRNWAPSPGADRALRESLQFCREQSIEVAILVMPVSELQQSWWSNESSQRMSEYLDELQRTYGAWIINAHSWLPEEEHYTDSHHLVKKGAEQFSRRLAEDVLEPWLAGPMRRDELPADHAKTGD